MLWRDVCLTLDEYAECPKHYFTARENTHVNFLPGKHNLSRSLILQGEGQFRLTFQPYHLNGTIDIVCTSKGTSIAIENVSFTVKALTLTDCRGDSYTLHISGASYVTIEGLTLLGGGAVIMENICGPLNISNGNFSNLSGPCKHPATLNIAYDDSIICTESSELKLYIEDMTFKNNTCPSIRVWLQQLRYSMFSSIKRVIIASNALEVNISADIFFSLGLSVKTIVAIDDCSFHGSNSIIKGLLFQEQESFRDYNFESVIQSNISITNSDISDYKNGSLVMEFLDQAHHNMQLLIHLDNVTIRNGSTQDECLSPFAIVFASRDTQQSIQMNNVTVENSIAGLSHCNGLFSSVSFFSFAHNVKVINCTFQNNTGTALTAVGTKVTFAGHTSFVNNTGVRGGAVALYAGGKIIPMDGATVLFYKNSAIDVGGAVYVSPCRYGAAELTEYFDQKCFIEGVFNTFSNIHILFNDNSANDGGDAIYGTMLSQCYVDFDNSLLGYKYLESVSNLNFSHPQQMSFISSKPRRVCICSNNTVQCNRILSRKSVYPGQLFEVEAALVGDMDGTAKGVIHAKLQGDEVTLGDSLQSVQQANLTTCTKLTYSILSLNLTRKYLLVLSPIRSPTDLPSKNDVKIGIHLLPCPMGFHLSNELKRCSCNQKLKTISVICNISSLKFYTQGKVWIGKLSLLPHRYKMYYSKSCPCNYCKEKPVSIQLFNATPGQQSLDQDIQCAYNRTGILCGGCADNFSLVLGSNRCLPGCTDNYLSLVIVFVFAGVALVLFIRGLNLTITEGTINGLIYYANIIAVDRTLFFPSGSIVRKHFMYIISWINLDLGIETCFFKYLDSYTKVWLQFVFPMYVLILALLIVVTSHYSMTASRIFGRNAVPVLATLVMLSYAKLFRTISYAISFIHLRPLNSQETIQVWFYDGNVEFLKGKHILLFVFSLAVLVLAWLPLTLVMLCSQWIQKSTHMIGLRWIAKFSPFFDALTGPFKSQHRYWVGILLLTRCVLIVIYASAGQTRVYVELACVVISSTLLMIGVGYIYKKVYIALLEYASLANLCILSTGTLYMKSVPGNQEALAGVSVAIASIQFIAIVLFHAWVELRQPARDLWLKVTRQREERIPLPKAITREYVRKEDYQSIAHSSSAKMVRIGSAHFDVDSFSQYREPLFEHFDSIHVTHDT